MVSHPNFEESPGTDELSLSSVFKQADSMYKGTSERKFDRQRLRNSIKHLQELCNNRTSTDANVEAAFEAHLIDSPLPYMECLYEVAKFFANKGNFEKLFKYVDMVKLRDSAMPREFYHLILRTAAGSTNREVAVNALQEMRTKNVLPNSQTFAYAVAVASSPQEALQHLDTMEKMGLSPSPRFYYDLWRVIRVQIRKQSAQPTVYIKQLLHDRPAHRDVVLANYFRDSGRTEDLEALCVDSHSPYLVRCVAILAAAKDQNWKVANELYVELLGVHKAPPFWRVTRLLLHQWHQPIEAIDWPMTDILLRQLEALDRNDIFYDENEDQIIWPILTLTILLNQMAVVDLRRAASAFLMLAGTKFNTHTLIPLELLSQLRIREGKLSRDEEEVLAALENRRGRQSVEQLRKWRQRNVQLNKVPI